MNKKKIYIACGGSAGHIFPGLTLAEELEKDYGGGVEILFLTSDSKIARSLFGDSRFDFYALSLARQRGTFSKNIKFIASLLKETLESTKVIFSNRPDCLVGFGSYIAGPPFVVASILRIPTLIHEQNTVMGKANRVMRKFATKLALSFPEPGGRVSKNAVITGNPIRKSAAGVHTRSSAIDSLGLSHDRFTILVIGGSQGSQTVNSVVAGMLNETEKQMRDKIQIIHISGEGDYNRLKGFYQNIDILYKLYPFFKDMGTVYSAADISISRAGASCICELCTHRIPSVLIPYPFAESHQVKNARFFESKKAAIIIEENNLSKTSLLRAVERLVNDTELRASISDKMGALAVYDAAKKLAREVASLAGLERQQRAEYG